MKPKFICNKIMSIELVSRNISQSQNACRNISQSKGKIKDQYKQTNILKQYYNTTYYNRAPLINDKNTEQECMNTLNFMCKSKHRMSQIIHKRTKNREFFTLNLHSAWGWKGE